jgi:hypothetical protein
MSLRSPLDIDARNNSVFVVLLRALDGTTHTDINATITVTDFQDTPPVFLSPRTAEISRTAKVARTVFTVSARDGDYGPVLRPVTYSLLANPGSYFLLGSSTGALQVTKSLLTAPALISLQIEACESGTASSFLTCTTITLTLTLKANQPPLFSSPGYFGSVEENSPNGKTVLSNIVVTNPEQDEYGYITLSLSQYSDVFTLSSVGGLNILTTALTVADSSALDYESNQKTYSFQIIASESQSPDKLNTSVSVVINITDANDNYPQFDRTSYSRQLRETAVPGTEVITITATDADSGYNGLQGVRYKITGNGAERFQCNTRTGRIIVAPCLSPGRTPCLDYETQQRYQLTFVAKDRLGEGLETTVPLDIELLNENDNVPVFKQKQYSSFIKEGETVPTPPVKVEAVDPDGSQNPLLYSIVGGDPNNVWQIGPQNGIVKANNPIDYEAIPGGGDRYELTVLASDGLNNVTA